MTALESPSTRAGIRSRGVVVLAAVAAAVALNLLVYTLGRIAGGEFAFTQGNSSAQVDAITVAGFSAVPLGLGLSIVALLVPRLPWIARAAIVVAPVLAIATIGIMTIPVDLDVISTIALAICHLTLAPISIAAIRRLRL
ncbi:DUF6069 family protein [Nocardioides okcheonensis]|uniref:DUF6069 family protein n=1 Tax=Nocardioides okcheonensis TaxID=2894081 RepID=UPI001E454036|nr:DUF6069 family protein [Nocardioides okcheonensis]UFN45164.1 DUF6069 family protein [Nocardioides okcheonensis]